MRTYLNVWGRRVAEKFLVNFLDFFFEEVEDFSRQLLLGSMEVFDEPSTAHKEGVVVFSADLREVVRHY